MAVIVLASAMLALDVEAGDSEILAAVGLGLAVAVAVDLTFRLAWPLGAFLQPEQNWLAGAADSVLIELAPR